MRAVIVAMLISRVAFAEGTDEFDDCKAQRLRLTAEAMKIADANERGERLAAMPTCLREPDGSTTVRAAHPRAPEDTTPFAPHLTAALRVGAAASAMSAGADTASGFGPLLELEAGWHGWRHVELAAYAGYTRFRDPQWNALVSIGPGQVMAATFDVTEQLYDAGARLRLHYGRVAFGGGAGIELEHGAVVGQPAVSNVLAQLGVDGALEVARTGQFAADVVAGATVAMDPNSDPARDVISAGLAVALRWR